MGSVSKRLRFDEDDDDGAWSREELEVFLKLYREYGENWEGISAGVAKCGFRRSKAELVTLFETHTTYISSEDASAAGLHAVVTDYQRLQSRLRTIDNMAGVRVDEKTSRAHLQPSSAAQTESQPAVEGTATRRRPRKTPLRKHPKLPAMLAGLKKPSLRIQHWLSNELAIRWALSEWFYSWIEVEFFRWSDFRDALDTDMRIAPDTRLTRAEWGRVRAAMCALYSEVAKPRRLSKNFLSEERAKLWTHLERTRAMTSSLLASREQVLARHPRCGLPRRAMVASMSANSRQVRVQFTPSSVTIVDDLDVAPVNETQNPMLGPVTATPGSITTPNRMRRNTLPNANWSGTMPSPTSVMYSPARMAEQTSGVALELDLRQLAEVLALLENKEALITQLWNLNDESKHLSDEHLKLVGSLAEVNRSLNPLVQSLGNPIAPTAGSTRSHEGHDIPPLANALARSASHPADNPAVFMSVTRCAALLVHASTATHQWQAVPELSSIVDRLGFQVERDDPAFLALRKATEEFMRTAQTCEYF